MHPMGFTQRIGIMSPRYEAIGNTDSWDYDKRFTVEAMIAFLTWDGVGDPPGPWIRNVNTGLQGPGSLHYRKDEGADQDDVDTEKRAS
jgi:hypothetical protein